MLRPLFAVLLILAAVFASARNPNAFAVQTVVEHGTIEGDYDTKTQVQTYLGIPYAQPPVGALRWRAPQPLAPWSGVRETRAFGPRAMQAHVWDDMKFRSAGVSEDCLYLNVWTPAQRDTTGLPVLVYIYGGGFFAGDGSEYRYDGTSMAQQGIVTVTINYRLNVFGFLAHPELSAESPYRASGNYGLLDQQAALAWVHRNIQAFGGDPEKITLAGESAGSISVSYHMASPLSRDFLAGAIGQSGAGIAPTLPPAPLAEAEQAGRDFLARFGITSLAEARGLSARDLYEMSREARGVRFPVVLDGHFLPRSLPEIFAAREQAQVPLLLGWNSAEAPAAAFLEGQPYTEDNYTTRIRQRFPDAADELLRLYPSGSPAQVERSAMDLASDLFIGYSTWRWFDLHRRHSEQPVFRYLYSKLRPPLQGQDPAVAAAAPGAPHACEIEYALGNLHLIDDYEWTADDRQVSATMRGFFANFIKTGNPNGAGLPEWPAAASRDARPPVMIIDTTSRVQPAEADARYQLLERLHP